MLVSRINFAMTIFFVVTVDAIPSQAQTTTAFDMRDKKELSLPLEFRELLLVVTGCGGGGGGGAGSGQGGGGGGGGGGTFGVTTSLELPGTINDGGTGSTRVIYKITKGVGGAGGLVPGNNGQKGSDGKPTQILMRRANDPEGPNSWSIVFSFDGGRGGEPGVQGPQVNPSDPFKGGAGGPGVLGGADGGRGGNAFGFQTAGSNGGSSSGFATFDVNRPKSQKPEGLPIESNRMLNGGIGGATGPTTNNPGFLALGGGGGGGGAGRGQGGNGASGDGPLKPLTGGTCAGGGGGHGWHQSIPEVAAGAQGGPGHAAGFWIIR